MSYQQLLQLHLESEFQQTVPQNIDQQLHTHIDMGEQAPYRQGHDGLVGHDGQGEHMVLGHGELVEHMVLGRGALVEYMGQEHGEGEHGVLVEHMGKGHGEVVHHGVVVAHDEGVDHDETELLGQDFFRL